MDYFKILGEEAYSNNPEPSKQFAEFMDNGGADKVHADSIRACDSLDNKLLLREMELAKKLIL